MLVTSRGYIFKHSSQLIYTCIDVTTPIINTYLHVYLASYPGFPHVGNDPAGVRMLKTLTGKFEADEWHNKIHCIATLYTCLQY